MATVWRSVQQKSSKAAEVVMRRSSEYYKQLLEENKQHIVGDATVEKCNELSKQLFYTRLASVPNRVESFWKEIGAIKSKVQNRQELKLEEIGIAALFVGECYAWTCLGEIIGRGSLMNYNVYK